MIHRLVPIRKIADLAKWLSCHIVHRIFAWDYQPTLTGRGVRYRCTSCGRKGWEP